MGRGRQLSRASHCTIQNRSDVMINALFNLSCSFSNRVVIHQPMSQTFGLSLICTAGGQSQTKLLSRRAILIYLAAAKQFVVIISFVQRRQVFLTTNESLISSWSRLSIDTLSFYSTMQSLDLLTLHFFLWWHFNGKVFQARTTVFFDDAEERTRMVFMHRIVYKIVYLYSESFFFSERGRVESAPGEC